MAARPSVKRMRPARLSSRAVRPEPDGPTTAAKLPGLQGQFHVLVDHAAPGAEAKAFRQ